MWKTIWSIASFIGLLAAALSLALLVQHALSAGLTPTFQLILDYYDWFRSAILSPLGPLAKSIAAHVAAFLNLNLVLANHWENVFVVMVLYLGARAKSYWDTGARQHASIRILFGVALSFLAAVLAGVWPDSGQLAGVATTATVLTSLLVFDLMDGAWAALMYRPQGQSFAREFARYLNFSFPTLGIGIGSIVLGLLLFVIGALPNDVRLGSMSLLIFALALSLYWAWRGWDLAGKAEYRNERETRWKRFRRSSTTRISVLMLTTMFGATCFFAMNAGHSLFTH